MPNKQAKSGGMTDPRRQLSTEASAAFARWLEDDSDQAFWQMADEDAWVDSASGGETNESHAESARVRA